jgi:hypothetical protein
MNMSHEYDSRIKQLCELASTELDSKKLNDLVTELTRVLDEKAEWRRGQQIGYADQTNVSGVSIGSG